jgi:hypothetical protein
MKSEMGQEWHGNMRVSDLDSVITEQSVEMEVEKAYGFPAEHENV